MPLFLLALAACDGDKPVDTGEPADADTDSDTDTDTDTDADPAWAHCPDASAYIGDAGWTGVLQANGATYCSASDEDRTLEEELDAKAMLRIPDGAYPVPTAEGTYALALPVCALLPSGPTYSPVAEGVGTTDVAPNTFGATTYTYVSGTQPLVAPTPEGTDLWTLAHTLVLVGPSDGVPGPLVLDGGQADAASGASSEFTLYRDGGSPYDLTSMTFAPCEEPDWTRNVHTVTFDGGEVELELWMGENLIETAPSAFVRATGTLDGTAFEVTDYFQLFYRPDHHHFGRHFAVSFGTMIGDVCALRIEDIDGQEGTTTARVTTAACDLSAIESRTVTAEDWQEG